MSRSLHFVSKSKARLTLLAVLLVALASAVSAIAYWTTTGTGSASAGAGTLTDPTGLSHSVTNGTVNLTWFAASVSGGGTVSYHVERRNHPGSTWTDVCGSSDAAPIAATSCSDTPGNGTFVYRVTARYASWHTTGAESSLITIEAAPYVLSITRLDPSPTKTTGTVRWTVTFSESVTGVNSTDFTLANTGLGGTPAITTVAPGVAVSSSSFVVTSSSGTGSGTLGLNLTDNDTIRDSINQPLENGSGGANGNFTGELYTVDRTLPTVANVTSPLANGSYDAGTVVPVTVTFSEPVLVTGPPQLLLETGATDRQASYASGSGTATLTFDYTVQAGDTSSDLNYVTTTSLTLNGGTIQDAATNSATLTLPATNNANSLGGSKAIVIDTTAPVVTLTSVNGSVRTFPYSTNAASVTSIGGACGTATGDTTTVAVTVDGNPASPATATCTAGAWTLTLSPAITAEDTYTLAATQADAAGNIGSSGNKLLTIERILPTVTDVSSPLANGAYKLAQVVPVTVTFSEPVIVTGTPQLTLSTGSPVTTAVNYTSGTGTSTLTFNYTVAAGNTSADLNYPLTTSLALNSGTIRDAATNNANLTLPPTGDVSSLGGNKNIVIDTTLPTVTSVTSTLADGSYDAGTVVPVTVTFSEPVTVTGTPQLTLSTGSPATTAVNYSSGSGTTTLTFNYTVAAGNTSADLNYPLTTSLALNGGTIQDAATNNATLTLPATGNASSLGGSKSIVVDTTAPVVTLTKVNNVAVTFPFLTTAASVTSIGGTCGSAGGDIGTVAVTVDGSPASPATTTCSAGAWTLTFSPAITAEDTYTLAATQADAAGNMGSSGNKLLTIDRSVPTVTAVSSPLADGSYKLAQVVPLTVTFSEPVVITATPQLTLSTGSPVTTAVNYTSGSGSSTLTFNYTVAAGNNSADLDYSSSGALAGGTIKDATGNSANLTLASPGATNSLGANKDILIDTSAPTNSLTLAASPAPVRAFMSAPNGTLYYKSNAAGSFTLVNTVTDGGSGPASATFPQVTTASWTHPAESVSSPPGGPFVSSTYSWASGAAAPAAAQRTFTSTDAAGNISAGTAVAITADTTGPVVTASTVADSDANVAGFAHQGGSYFVYATATEAGSGIGSVTANVSTITTGATAAPLSPCATDCTISGVTYTYKSAQQTADSSLAATAKSYSITAVDNVTNTTTNAPPTVAIDNTAPTLTAANLQMFDINTEGHVDRVTAALNETLGNCTDAGSWTLSNAPSGGTLTTVTVATTVATLTLTEGAGPADTSVGSFTLALGDTGAGICDRAGNRASFAATVPADKAAPVPVTITDTDGTTDGKMEAGDTLVVTFSEAITSTITSPITITESDPNGGGNDTLTIPGLTNGALDTGSNLYITSNNSSATFAGSTLILSNGNKTLTATVGITAGGSGITAAGGPNTFVFAASTGLTDAAGNTATGSVSVLVFKIF